MKKVTILVLHLSHGGIEKQTVTLANELCKNYKVNIISTYSLKSEPAYKVDESINIKYLIDGGPNKEAFFRATRSKNPFKILKEGFFSLKILYLKHHLMKREIKKLSCDFVISSRIEFAHLLSRFAPKNLKRITVEHNFDPSAKYAKRVKRAFKDIDNLVVLSTAAKKLYKNWLKDNKKTETVRIENMLPFVPKEKCQLEGNRLLAVGRLHKIKNFEVAVKILYYLKKDIPDATLTIVGDGEERAKLEGLAKKLNLENSVYFEGFVPEEKVIEFMLSSDVLLVTSLSEAFPMVLLEAGSVGLPSIGFDVPSGMGDIIKDGQNGYMLPPFDAECAAKNAAFLLKNREKLKEMGKNAAQNATHFSPEDIIDKWHNILR